MATVIRRPPWLPNELYRDIIAHVPGRAELATLCIVSSTLRFEAERVLYRVVEVLEYRRISSWSVTIASSSCLAGLVHSITFPSSIDTPTDMIRQALGRTVNLKYLAIKSSGSWLPLVSHSCVQTDMLIGCGFRLYGLSGELHWYYPGDLWQVFSEQSEIRSWALGKSARLYLPSLPRRILPNLSELDLPMPSLLPHFASKPIEYLSVSIPWSFPNGIEQLALFKNTLISLTFRIEGMMLAESIRGLIAIVVDQVPDIKSFHYYAKVTPDPVRLFRSLSWNKPSLMTTHRCTI